MRILIVVPYLYPALAYGGPAKVVYDLVVELAKRHVVTVFTTDSWNSERRILEKEKLKGIKNLSIQYFQNLVNKSAYRDRFFTAFGMVFSYLKQKDQFDIVHINDVFVLPNLLIGCLARLYKKPYVFSPHGVLDPIRMKQKHLLKDVIYKLIAKSVLSNAKIIVATSQKEKEDLYKLGFRKVNVLENGIPIRKKKPGREFVGYENRNLFTLLYIGKIHPLKGLKELVLAIKDLKFPYQLLVAGPDDGDLANLKEVIKKSKIRNIHFLGYVDDEEKAELFEMSDVFVYPSFSEGFSISILEAMSYGLPVLITKACNFPEVEEYKAGVIVNEKNLIKELGQSLTAMKNNIESLRKMGKNAESLVRNKYSIDIMGEEAQKIYEDAI